MSTQPKSLEPVSPGGFSAHEAPTVAARDLSRLVAACADVGARPTATPKLPPIEIPPLRPTPPPRCPVPVMSSAAAAVIDIPPQASANSELPAAASAIVSVAPDVIDSPVPPEILADAELGAENEEAFWSEAPRYSNFGESVDGLSEARPPRAIARRVSVFVLVAVALLVLCEMALLLAR